MSMYICNECGRLLDSDLVGFEEDPQDGTEGICPDCYEDLYGEEDE